MLLLGLSAALAQTEKGRWTVGASVGNLSYYTSGNNRYPSSSNFSASLSPSAGYFVARNLVVGLTVPVSYFGYRSEAAGSNAVAKIRSTEVGLSPFARLYFGQGRLRPFASVAAGITRQWYMTTNLGAIPYVKSTSTGFSYSGGAGLAYFINNTVSLDASLVYQRGGRANGSGLYSEGLTDSGTLGLNLGFRLFFGK